MGEFALGTDAILDALRGAIGTSVTIGEDPNVETYEFPWIIEGPPLRWLGKVDDYPAIVFQVKSTLTSDTVEQARRMVQHQLPITVWVEFHSELVYESVVTPYVYGLCRKIGDAVVKKIMDAGAKMGLEWLAKKQLVANGMNDDLMNTLEEQNVAIYGIDLVFEYFNVSSEAPVM